MPCHSCARHTSYDGDVDHEHHELHDKKTGETLGFLCLECGNLDEDVMEIIHEEGCGLKAQTAPTP